MPKGVRVRFSLRLPTNKNENYEKVGILIIETEAEDGTITRDEYQLDKKDISALKTLILGREKEVMLQNPMNVREAQAKDKILSKMNKLQWWNW